MRVCDYCGQSSDEPQCPSCGSRSFGCKRSPEEEYALGLSLRDVHEAIAEGKREFTLREERLALEHAIEFFKKGG